MFLKTWMFCCIVYLFPFPGKNCTPDSVDPDPNRCVYTQPMANWWLIHVCDFYLGNPAGIEGISRISTWNMLKFTSIIKKKRPPANQQLIADTKLKHHQDLIVWLWHHPYEFCQKAFLGLLKQLDTFKGHVLFIFLISPS